MQAADSNKPPRKLRKLRIAWSIVCGIACVLLIALWVRSYHKADGIHIPVGADRTLLMASFPGSLSLHVMNDSDVTLAIGWHVRGWGWQSTELPHPEQLTLPMFGFGSKKGDTFIMFPIWLPIIIFGALSIILGLQRPYRFSLRTLLLAMTLVAVVLGLVVWVAS